MELFTRTLLSLSLAKTRTTLMRRVAALHQYGSAPIAQRGGACRAILDYLKKSFDSLYNPWTYRQ